CIGQRPARSVHRSTSWWIWCNGYSTAHPRSWCCTHWVASTPVRKSCAKSAVCSTSSTRRARDELSFPVVCGDPCARVDAAEFPVARRVARPCLCGRAATDVSRNGKVPSRHEHAARLCRMPYVDLVEAAGCRVASGCNRRRRSVHGNG